MRGNVEKWINRALVAKKYENCIFFCIFLRKNLQNTICSSYLCSVIWKESRTWAWRSGWSRNGRVAFSNHSTQMSLGDIKRLKPPLPHHKRYVGLCWGPQLRKHKERSDMIAEMIIPIDTLRGQLRKDGYYFRMYKGKQIVQRCPNRKEHVKTANEQANQERFIERYRKKKPTWHVG